MSLPQMSCVNVIFYIIELICVIDNLNCKKFAVVKNADNKRTNNYTYQVKKKFV
jgi:hypothetical protein